MKIIKLNYKRAIYKIDRQSRDLTIRDYVLSKVVKGESKFFTEIIRIEKDNGFHRRSRFFDNWLYLRDDTNTPRQNWKRCTKSGLAFTGHEFVFEGNIPIYVELPLSEGSFKKIENPEHFLLVQISQDFRYVVIDIFEEFYPNKRELIQYIISSHDFYFKRYKKGA